MNLLDIKHFQRFANQTTVKVLRHKSTTEDLWELRRNGKFETYQNHQSWDVFGDAHFIISFIAERHNFAKFVGVWEIMDKNNGNDKTYHYQTKELEGFKDLSARVIVQWGEGLRSWAQWLHNKGNKEISEILPPNYIMDFPGYYDFILSFSELKQMINNPDANRVWYQMLSSISGVYVILDKTTGNQYVGSAYGKKGLWGRWNSYVQKPHGGNKLIKELLYNNPKAYKNFQFSILRVLEPNATREEILAHENLIKKKLGSKAFGLNDN